MSHQSLIAAILGSVQVPTPVAYWPFTSNADDKTGAHNGTATNVTYVAGLARNVANFDGTSSVVITADSDDFSFTDGSGIDTPFSISLLVRYDSAITTYYSLLTKRTSGGAVEWRVLNYSTYFEVALYTTNSIHISRRVATLGVGVWNHIAITYDGSETAEGIKIYKNNVLQSATTSNAGTYTGMVNTNGPLTMSRFGSTSAGYLDGKMGEVAIWKGHELTTSEINKVYTRAISGTDLI